NAELINTYKTIRDNCEELVSRLKVLKGEYMNAQEQKEYYYAKREEFNNLKINGNEQTNLEKAALFIFLNKTCFNGLYRVNRKGGFNVPMGSYKNPAICDEDNLKNISKALQKVTIICGDYTESEKFIDENTFVYFDPPYRPLTETASFNTYTEDGFSDRNQTELAEFVHKLTDKGAKVVVSNSDPKNVCEEDNFFDELYSAFKINRIAATRMINSNASARGKISELLIANY
ncbi:MAG: Dam family site-specific DNA-(adenine-N6)-methyltransferase, partial [Dysgonamonadaceae bacterium]|nr:Dam family site-specific DNA-(adenine-N6)-methyltransferase [Dysgonamonadaceae bacterium]